jgi:epoxyqueuosine reductase QueG
MLPGAKTAISLIRTHSKDINNKRVKRSSDVLNGTTDYHIDSVCYDLTRDVEAYGFRSLMTIASSASHYDPTGPTTVNRQIAKDIFKDLDCEYSINTVFTRKTLPERALKLDDNQTLLPKKYNSTANLTGMIKDYAKEVGADLCGVASAERISSIAEQLRPHFDGEKYLNASDKSHRFKLYDPVITEETRQMFVAEDYMPRAKSVIVIGLRYHQKVLEFATKPPAEAVGPYTFQTYVTQWQGDLMASKIVQKLNHMGHKAVITNDLMGVGTAIASPRGFVEDLFSNRFVAIASGLGSLAESGRVISEEFGTRQRFIAIVTDAELNVDDMVSQIPELCKNCEKFCIKSCPTAAITSERITFECEGVSFGFNKRDINRCDWSKRYAITGDSGFKYLGSPLDDAPSGEITAETLGDALKKHDPIKKYRPVACEPCMIECPYSW